MKVGKVRVVVTLVSWKAARTGQLEEWSVEKHLYHRLRGSLNFVSKSIRLCCGLRKRKYCGGVKYHA